MRPSDELAEPAWCLGEGFMPGYGSRTASVRAMRRAIIRQCRQGGMLGVAGRLIGAICDNLVGSAACGGNDGQAEAHCL